MKSFLQGIVLLGCISLSAFGAKPVATITSATPFSLDGHSMSTPGVTSFPVVMGDTVSTSDGSAVLLFSEGSRSETGRQF